MPDELHKSALTGTARRRSLPRRHWFEMTTEEFGTAEATGTGLLRSNAMPARASTGAAHAAFLAADRGWPVVSARPGPIRAMHPEVEIEPLP